MLLQGPHYRNLALTLLVMILVFTASARGLEAAPHQQAVDFSWNPANRTIVVAPSTFTQVTATLTNNNAAPQTYNLSILPASLPTGWTVSIAPATAVTLNPGGSQVFTFTIGSPTTVGSSLNVTIRATRTDNAVADFPIVVSVQTPTATPSTSSFSWNPVSTTITAQPGGAAAQANLTLQSNSTGTQSYTISTNIADFPGWNIIIAPSTTVSITGNSSVQFAFFVSAPATAAPGSTISLQVTATRQSDNTPIIGVINVTVAAATATPTRTSTATPTTGPVCPEGSRDPGGDLNSARLILVDTPNNHGICFQGDEDWFKFGGIGGKVYTIDITRFDAGIDLIIELYDENGVRLAVNDDFFARTPAPTAAAIQTPLPTRDIAPRIQSWRAPRDGIYYIRVRDTAGIGGRDKTYTLVVFSESYGPTPPIVSEICRDLFEEDGLPEQAKLITSNEIQPSHRLCPVGDADWVKFFGKSGKTYYIYTDTRPYRNNPAANPSTTESEAGADTQLYLVDRDGLTILDFSDDIDGPDGSSLDSQIRFVPRVDGFYFAQVKNTGDIGNQFIRYDIVLTQCAPGRDDCGRAKVATSIVPTPAPASTQTPLSFNPTATSAVGTATPVTLTPTVLAFLEQSQRPGLVNGPLVGFADPTFNLVWQRTDQLVAQNRVNRSWLWGPRGLMARSEGYVQAEGGLRQVQYFDKGRMEVSNPAGDRSSPWFVTSGLLATELVTGRMQVGDTDFVQRGPADIPIAGDLDSPTGPTYASFLAALDSPSGDRTGSLPLETIDRSGQFGTYSGPERAETRLTRFVAETNHNIPDVFWRYLNANGPINERGQTRTGQLMNWVFTMGYPVSEPFWARVQVGGNQRLVLIQIFQRRVLTYDPANASGWQVEMGNVGRHYYRWRYGEDLPSS